MDKKKIMAYVGCVIAALVFIELTIYSVMRVDKYTDLNFFPIAALFGCLAINMLVLAVHTLIFKKKRLQLTVTITNVVLALAVFVFSIHNFLTTTKIFGKLTGIFLIFWVLPIPVSFLIINLIIYVIRKQASCKG